MHILCNDGNQDPAYHNHDLGSGGLFDNTAHSSIAQLALQHPLEVAGAEDYQSATSEGSSSTMGAGWAAAPCQDLDADRALLFCNLVHHVLASS